MMIRLLSFTFLLVALASPAMAQSHFATEGLGVPLVPLDARARALGGIGTGLLGTNASLVNPAEVAGLRRRGIAASIQPSSRTIEVDGARDNVAATRFPLLRIVYPISPRFTGTIGYGGMLDQSWGRVVQGTEVLNGDSVATRDVLDSDGGITQVRGGVAMSVTPTLAVGVEAGLYTGHLDRELSRTFPGRELDFGEFRSLATWRYRAPMAVLGVRWDPLPEARAGLAVTWAGNLQEDSTGGPATSRSYSMPYQIDGGASALLAPRMLVGVSGRWANWNVASDGLGSPDAARDVWGAGAGFEWEAIRAAERSVPVRLGFRYDQFPFRVGGVAPSEWSVGLGAGLLIPLDVASPRAAADVVLERGGRGNGGQSGMTESFWRFTMSMSLFGL